MTVENKYVNSDLANDKLANPALMGGAKVVAFVSSFEVAIADDDGSVYRIAKAIQPSLIPVQITIYNDAITGSTDWDLGLYEVGVDAPVVDADVFMDGTSMAGARALGSGVSGLTAVDVANLTKKIYEHAGDDVTDYKAGYDLALTANTVGSAVGTITVVAIFIEG